MDERTLYRDPPAVLRIMTDDELRAYVEATIARLQALHERLVEEA